MTSRSYCWTMNNYDAEAVENIHRTFEHDSSNDGDHLFRYIIWGCEVGESGTPHLQGYMELTKPVRFTQLLKYDVFAHTHFEKRRGTREQARDYCKKEGNWAELGKWGAGGQGSRTDLHCMVEAVRKGASKLELMEADPTCYSKHMRFIDAYRAEVEKVETQDFRHVTTEVLVGPAGCGKTSEVHRKDPEVFTVNCHDSFPFDGYDGERAILLDDFYGDMKYSQLLRVLDGHQFRVNVKGHHRYARWERVYITSNKAPEQWYASMIGHPHVTPALARRLTSIRYFNSAGESNDSCHYVTSHEETGNSEPSLRNRESIDIESIINSI